MGEGPCPTDRQGIIPGENPQHDLEKSEGNRRKEKMGHFGLEAALMYPN